MPRFLLLGGALVEEERGEVLGEGLGSFYRRRGLGSELSRSGEKRRMATALGCLAGLAANGDVTRASRSINGRGDGSGS
jgi:hypothetical protein